MAAQWQDIHPNWYVHPHVLCRKRGMSDRTIFHAICGENATIIDLVRYELKRQGWTIPRMAMEAHVPAQEIHDILEGQPANRQTVLDIARACGIKPSDVVSLPGVADRFEDGRNRIKDDGRSAFGVWVNSLRRSYDLKVSEIAQRAGVTSIMLHRYCKGDVKPSLDVIARFAAAFGVPVNHLVAMVGRDDD